MKCFEKKIIHSHEENKQLNGLTNLLDEETIFKSKATFQLLFTRKKCERNSTTITFSLKFQPFVCCKVSKATNNDRE